MASEGELKMELATFLADELVRRDPGKALTTILKAGAHGECEWLEFKASFLPPPTSQPSIDARIERLALDDDYAFHVAKAVIALANTVGGAVLVGVDDAGSVISLEGDGIGVDGARARVTASDQSDLFCRTLQAAIGKGEWRLGRGGRREISHGRSQLARLQIRVLPAGDRKVLAVLVPAAPIDELILVRDVRTDGQPGPDLLYHRQIGDLGMTAVLDQRADQRRWEQRLLELRSRPLPTVLEDAVAAMTSTSVEQIRFTGPSHFDAGDLIQRCRLCLDTSFLLGLDAPETIGVLLPLLRDANRTALVGARTVLACRAGKDGDPRHAEAAREQGRRLLADLDEAGRLTVAEDPPHLVSDNRFDTGTFWVDTFVQYQMKIGLALVTDNEDTARRILLNAGSAAIEVRNDVHAVHAENKRLVNWAARLSHPASPLQESGVDLDDLARLASRFRVITDTSTLMFRPDGEPVGARFLGERLLPVLRGARNPLIVPIRVRRELERHSASAESDKRDGGTAGLSVLSAYEREDLLRMPEDDNEVVGASQSFADPVFVRIVVRFQRLRDLCIVTQDTELARQLIANRDAASGHRLLVVFVGPGGRLHDWVRRLSRRNEKRNDAGSTGSSEDRRVRKQQKSEARPAERARRPTSGDRTASPLQTPADASSRRPDPFKFKTASTPRPQDSLAIGPEKPPGEGDTVVTERGARSVRLLRLIDSGGEGAVFETDLDGQVCKIYDAANCTAGRRDKLRRMTADSPSFAGVCWPSEVVANRDGQFVGFLMPRAEGRTLGRCLFAKPLLKKYFPNWTRVELVTLALTLLDIVGRLHEANVLIGDINPHNILVADPRRAFLIDADSFQIEDFPCPVGTEGFTPAARQGQAYASYLRSHDDEMFAVATLLFMILLPGKAPYSALDGGEIGENIRQHRFPYSRNASGRPPDGPWFFIWTHLPLPLKQAFEATFEQDQRPSLAKLQFGCRDYLKLLSAGKSEPALFPDKPRLVEGRTAILRCESCPPGQQEHEVSAALAEKVLADGRGWRCKRCASERKLKRVLSTRVVNCSRRVSPDCLVTYEDNESFLSDLRSQARDPICPRCREHLRSAGSRQSRSAGAGSGGARHSRRHQQKECFVATAAFGNVDAPEVAWLRRYRNQVLLSSAGGRLFCDAYWTFGPLLAALVRPLPPLRNAAKLGLTRLVAILRRHHPDIP